MILARLIPKNSDRYTFINNIVDIYSIFFEKHKFLYLFSVWTVTMSGFVFNKGQIDRFSYWDWSEWEYGLIKIIISSIFFLSIQNKNFIDVKLFNKNNSVLIKEFLFLVLYFFIGLANFNIFDLNIILISPYLFAIAGGLFLYRISIKYDSNSEKWDVINWENKLYYFSASFILLIISTYLGYLFDDPIISTVSMISLFFPAIVLLWPSHVRHILRSQFYPLFTFSMFVSVRAPWFLIILFILFFISRSINYLKYGIIYPSFGVDQEDILGDV